MRRIAVVGLLALLIAPGAWSSGAVHTSSDRGLLWRSILESVGAWMPDPTASIVEQRDLSHLLMVPRDRQTDGVVSIDALDERLSQANLQRARAQRAANMRRFPTASGLVRSPPPRADDPRRQPDPCRFGDARWEE